MSTSSQQPFNITASDALNGIAKVVVTHNWDLMPENVIEVSNITDMVEFELEYNYIFPSSYTNNISWNNTNQNKNKSLIFQRQITNKFIKNIKNKDNISNHHNKQNKIYFNLSSFKYNVNNASVIMFRVPSSILNYKIQCKLRYFVDTTTYTSQWSQTFYINVNSSLIQIDNFKNGDKVTYRPPNISLQCTGQIIDIKSIDNKEDQITIKNRSNEILTVGKSRVVAEDINAVYVIDLSPPEYLIDMYKHLFLKSNPLIQKECFNIFIILYEIYLNQSIKFEGKKYFTKHYSWYWHTEHINLTEHLCVNIIGYLYDINGFKWKLQCILNQNDNLMIEWNLMKYIYEKYFEKIKENYELYKNYDPNCRYFTCDICRIEILGWDIMYRCQERACNSHNICKYCSFNMILTNTQINSLLMLLLENKLNIDCIKQISSFVAGNVLKI
eukprot:191314_1